jgi:glycosyltransferase involved in cell wall biosynthesis
MTRDIVINGRFLSRRVTGVERYGREIISLMGSRCRVVMTRENGSLGHAWEQFVLPVKLNPKSILWSPANTGPLMVGNQALTIHDLSPLEHPEWFNKKFAMWYRLFLPSLAKRVRVVFTPSEFVRKKILKHLKDTNVIVTPNGVDTTRFHPQACQLTYKLPQRYILFVGSLQPRKNIPGLLNAWRAIQDDFKDTWLVIVGEAGQVFQGIKFVEEKRIHFMKYVNDDDLPGIYAQADLLVLPSYDEGFGLPVIEAMACGTPVIVSDGGALPEVVGDAGLIFELSNPDGLTKAIRECLSRNDLRQTLKEKGLAHIQLFTWKQTTELIWNTLNEI